MIWRIELKDKPGIFDAIGEGIKKDILDLNIKNVTHVEFSPVYIISGNISRAQAETISSKLLTDPITQTYKIKKMGTVPTGTAPNFHIVEAAYNPGVMDPVEESTKKGILDLGIKGVTSVKTAKRFIIKGPISSKQLKYISEKLLYNKVIQHVVKKIGTASIFSDAAPTVWCCMPKSGQSPIVEVDIRNAGNHKLIDISKHGQLYLNLQEMQIIKEYFKKLGRAPSDIELETLAQTWSEHCKHKTFRGVIEYNNTIIDNLLKETVMKATKTLNKKWCVSVFEDNAGVIRFDKNFNICFKAETHNHPSALEPYGGAGTGLGGVIRDPLGTGQGAKPIASTDIFCFGPPDSPHSKLPAGTLHPKRIMKGVVAGVRDYGNRMGIPTINGAVLFDERYIGNPLVFCGNIGIMPRNKSFKKVDPGDLVVLVGGRTGRDGIHGATFSSAELTSASENISSSAVQIGNPITEKKVTDTLLKARDADLYKAITDCGGGGLSSAVGEMGEETGVEVYLERVHLKYEGLSYTEIWISESQERMLLAVEPAKLKRLKNVFEREDVEVVVIGRFTDNKRLRLSYKNKVVADMDMKFLHSGLPKPRRKAVWKQKVFKEPLFKEPADLSSSLLQLLSSYNISSKEWIIRQYDHEVQGGSVLKPLQGIDNDGPGDASIIRPILSSKKGIIVSNVINPRYSFIDPYWMAASAIDEALRQIISVGGNLDEVAILDNFCWGNTDKPEELGSLVRAAKACHDMAVVYGTPFISGKDSLNNEYKTKKGSISIPGTLLISAIGIMPDVEKAISMDLKEEENFIYLVGKTFRELGASHYWMLKGFVGNSVPKVRPKKAKKIMDTLSKAVSFGLVRSCHDLSEGGLGVAAAEMAFSGGLGMEINLAKIITSPERSRRAKVIRQQFLRNDELLFSESNTRFLVEVPQDKSKHFEKAMKAVPFSAIGCVTRDKFLKIFGMDEKVVINASLKALKSAWQKPFKNA